MIEHQHQHHHESSTEKELLNVGSSLVSSNEGLKRSKRCINSLDRSASRSSSRMSGRSRKSKSPSVASEEDYKKWFDTFDNHISSELTVPEREDNDDDDGDEFDSEMEEENLLMDADDSNLDAADMCNIDEDCRDVSISVTLNLKQPSKQASPCHPCEEFQHDKVYKTKADEINEMQKLWETKNRRLSIVPSTEVQQQNYVSMLHPEDFTVTKSSSAAKKEPHEHHEHLHNVGYSEWMKKIVDHHSSHLTLSDSDSDSDVPLDEVKMLPLFCDEKTKKKRRRKK
jgi:hypothetical protein